MKNNVTFSPITTVHLTDTNESYQQNTNFEEKQKPKRKSKYKNIISSNEDLPTENIYLHMSKTSQNKNLLAFADINIGPSTEHSVFTPALMDSGASGTIISLPLFTKLNSLYELKYEKCKRNLVLPDQNTVNITHKCMIPFIFKNSEKHTVKITYQAFVAQFCPYDVVIGLDFHKDYKINVDYGNENFTIKKDNKEHKIKFEIRKECRNVALQALEEKIIPPGKIEYIKSKPSHPHAFQNNLLITSIDDEDDQDYTIIDTIQEKSKQDIYLVPVQNLTDQYIRVLYEQELAQLESLEELNMGMPILNNMKIAEKFITPCGKKGCTTPKYNPNKHDVWDNFLEKTETNTGENVKLNNFTTSTNKREAKKRRRNKREKEYNELWDIYLNNFSIESKLKQQDLTDQEFKEAVKQYHKEGYVQNTHEEMLDKLNLTEIEMSEAKILTEEEAMGIIENNLKHLTDSERKKTMEVFRKHPEVLAMHLWDVLETPLITADISLKEDAEKLCRHCIPHSIPLHMKRRVNNALQAMLSAGIIEVNTTPTTFLSNIVIVSRKDGRMRICLDLRLLNFHTKKLPCPLLSHQQVLSQFHNVKHVSNLDISNAFYSIPVRKDQKHLLSFYGPDNTTKYALTRLAQGYKNSTHFLQLLLSKVTQNIKSNKGKVSFYADDIFILSNGTYDEHLQLIDELLAELAIARLKAKPSKIFINQESLSILGFIFNKNKFTIPKAVASAITQTPQPTSPKGVKSFLMRGSFFRDHCIKFADITHPLLELIKSKMKKKFKWEKHHEKAFQETKKMIANAIALSAPIPHKPIFTASDASDYCSSFIIFQFDEHNNYIWLGCASKTFKETEQRKSIYFKELKAIANGFASYKYILEGATHITLFTDSRSILYIRSTRNSSYPMIRLALALSTYNITIRHLPSPLNQLPDLITRAELPPSKESLNINYSPLTPEQAEKLLQHIIIPDDWTIPADILKNILTSDSINNTAAPKKAKKHTKSIVQESTLLPELNRERKIKVPPTIKGGHYKHRPSMRENNSFNNQYENMNSGPYLYTSTQNEMSGEANSNDSKEDHNNDGTEEKTNDKDDSITKWENDMEKIDIEGLNEELEPTNQPIDTLTLNSKIITADKIPLEVMRHGQSMDKYIQELLKSLPKSFCIKNGILTRYKNEKYKIVLPDSLLDTAIYSAHYTEGFHNKPTAMHKILEDAWHPKLIPKIRQFYEECLFCQLLESTNAKQLTFGEKKYATQPRVQWAFDVLYTTIPVNNYKYLFLFVDTFSLFKVLVPAKTRESSELLQAFKSRVLQQFGMCKSFYSDCETAVKSHEFVDYCKSKNIAIDKSSPYAHFSNVAAESSIRYCKIMMRMFIAQEGQSWLKLLPDVTIAINSKRTHTGFSPEQLMYGTKLSGPNIYMETLTHNGYKDFAEKLTQIMDKNTEEHIKLRKEMNDIKRDYINKSRKEITFNISDIVLLKNLAPLPPGTPGSALTKPKFLGPYEIIEIHSGEKTAQLRDLFNDKIRFVHLSNVKKITDCAGKKTIIPLKFKHLLPNTKLSDKNKKEQNEPQHTYNLRSSTN